MQRVNDYNGSFAYGRKWDIALVRRVLAALQDVETRAHALLKAVEEMP